MALALGRSYRFRKRIGSINKQAVSPVSDAQLVSAVIAGSDLVVTFDQPVILNGFPASWVTVGLVPSISPISAVLTSETVVTLTFASALLGATAILTTPYDPAIRTKSGGYGNSGSFPAA